MNQKPQVQHVYEALFPYEAVYPFRSLIAGNVCITDELPQTGAKGEISAGEVDMVITHKLRPVVILDACLEYGCLAIPLHKVPEAPNRRQREYIAAVAMDKVAERHYIGTQRYKGALPFNSIAHIDHISRMVKCQIFYHRCFLEPSDFNAILAKTKYIIERNRASREKLP